MKKSYLFLLLLVTSLLLPAQVMAFETFPCNSNPQTPYTLRVDKKHFYIIGNPQRPEWDQAVRTAVDIFNKNPSNLRLTYSSANNSGSDLFRNSHNEIYWTIGLPEGRADAQIDFTNCTIDEADIRFDKSNWDNRINWTASLEKSHLNVYGGREPNQDPNQDPNQNSRSMILTLIHELGHSAGLQHEANYYNIMGADETHFATHQSQIVPYLGEDAANGLVALYGLRSEYFEDVGVVSWSRTGFDFSAGSSTHMRHPLQNSSGQNLPQIGGSFAAPIYQAQAGQNIRFNATYENNGKSPQFITARYYLTADIDKADFGQAGDVFLRETQLNLIRDTPDELFTALTIPANTPAGNYRIVVVLDPLNRLAEAEERNNAAYVRVAVSSSGVVTPSPTPSVNFDPNSFYSLVSRWQTGQSLDIDSTGNVRAAATQNVTRQHWTIADAGNGFYRLVSRWQTDKSLDIDSAGNVRVATTQNMTGQHWTITDAGNGFYRLVSRWQTDKSLDLDGTGNVRAATTQNVTGQHWTIQIQPQPPATSTNFDPNSFYSLVSRWQTDKSLDLDGTGNVRAAATQNVTGQHWTITDVGNGFYRLVSRWQTDKSLDLDGTGNVRVATTQNVTGQHWTITDVGNGFYRLVSRWQTDKSLDLDGTGNIRTAATQNVTGQHWIINKH